VFRIRDLRLGLILASPISARTGPHRGYWSTLSPTSWCFVFFLRRIESTKSREDAILLLSEAPDPIDLMVLRKRAVLGSTSRNDGAGTGLIRG